MNVNTAGCSMHTQLAREGRDISRLRQVAETCQSQLAKWDAPALRWQILFRSSAAQWGNWWRGQHWAQCGRFGYASAG